MRKTGLMDRNGAQIMEGDRVSLDGNMTADDSMGLDPNGFIFDETDVYSVYWDDKISNWSLDMGIQPDSSYNTKLLNHAVALLHSGDVYIIVSL